MKNVRLNFDEKIKKRRREIPIERNEIVTKPSFFGHTHN